MAHKATPTPLATVLRFLAVGRMIANISGTRVLNQKKAKFSGLHSDDTFKPCVRVVVTIRANRRVSRYTFMYVDAFPDIFTFEAVERGGVGGNCGGILQIHTPNQLSDQFAPVPTHIVRLSTRSCARPLVPCASTLHAQDPH